MIDVHYWPTPNGWKVTIMLEECGLPYKVFPVNIREGEQFKPDFLKIAPNNRMPAIVDHDTGAAIFESGAILIYLAEKTGRFLPEAGLARYDVMQWLMWQMGGIGPMSGQANHFRNYAKDKLAYAIDRYSDEVNRLYGVLDRRLKDRAFMAGEYSIADIATYPWVIGHANFGQETLDDFPNMKRWFETIQARPAVAKGYAVMEETRKNRQPMDDKTRAIYFGQTAATVRAHG
jgi:GSH-dependent disulfide-bond oxidoreductase